MNETMEIQLDRATVERQARLGRGEVADACREALTNPPTETPLLSIEGAALDAKLVELHDVAESIQILAEGIVDSTALSQTPEAEPKDAPPWLPVLNATLSILEGPKAGWDRLEGFNFEGIKEDLNRRLEPMFVECADNPAQPVSESDAVREERQWWYDQLGMPLSADRPSERAMEFARKKFAEQAEYATNQSESVDGPGDEELSEAQLKAIRVVLNVHKKAIHDSKGGPNEPGFTRACNEIVAALGRSTALSGMSTNQPSPEDGVQSALKRLANPNCIICSGNGHIVMHGRYPQGGGGSNVDRVCPCLSKRPLTEGSAGNGVHVHSFPDSDVHDETGGYCMDCKQWVNWSDLPSWGNNEVAPPTEEGSES